MVKNRSPNLLSRFFTPVFLKSRGHPATSAHLKQDARVGDSIFENNWLLLEERSFSRTICTFRWHSRKMNTTYPQLHDLYFVNLKLKFTKSYHRRSYRPATFCAFFGSNWRICDFGRRFWSTSADFHWKWIPRTHNSTIYILLIWSWNSQKAITEEVTVLQLFMSKLGSDPTWMSHNFSTSDF